MDVVVYWNCAGGIACWPVGWLALLDAGVVRCPRGPVGIAALLCRGQTAGGGSIPRWSASKPQVR